MSGNNFLCQSFRGETIKKRGLKTVEEILKKKTNASPPTVSLHSNRSIMHETTKIKRFN